MKMISILIMLFLVISCLVLAYLWIDRSITLSYVQVSLSDEMARSRQYANMLLIEWKGLTAEDVYSKLQNISSDSLVNVVKKEGDVIFYNQIKFIFKNNRLDAID